VKLRPLNFAFFVLFLAPTWTLLAFGVRWVLGDFYHWGEVAQYPVLFAALGLCGLLSQKLGQFFDPEKPSILYLPELLWALALAYPLAWRQGKLADIIAKQFEANRYALGGSDWAFHTSISNYLMYHGALNQNPFYQDGHLGYHHFYNLLVAQIAGILGINAPMSFVFVSPWMVLAGFVALCWWMMIELRLSGERFGLRGFLPLGFLAWMVSEGNPYSQFSMIYGVGLAFLLMAILRRLAHKTRRDNRFLLPALIILGLGCAATKMFYFLPLLTAAGATLLLNGIKQKRQLGKAQWFMINSFNIKLVLTFLVIFGGAMSMMGDFAKSPYQIDWAKLFFENGAGSFITQLAQGSLIPWIWVGSLILALISKEGYEFLFWGVVALTAHLISVSFVPTLYEAGASHRYASFSILAAELIILGVSLAKLPIEFTQSATMRLVKKRVYRGFLGGLLVLVVLAEYQMVGRFDFFPRPVFGRDLDYPPRGQWLKMSDFINSHLTKEDGIITNYWDLNRHYGLTAWIKTPPFLSSGQYGFVDQQEDIFQRRKALQIFFRWRISADLFRLLAEEYPKVRYLLIDDSLVGNLPPSSTNPVIWENHVYTRLSFEEIEAQIQSPGLPPRQLVRADPFSGYADIPDRVYYHLVGPMIKDLEAKGQLEPLFFTQEAGLYRINP